ncbi:HAD family hydrolase [soil metagenome]
MRTMLTLLMLSLSLPAAEPLPSWSDTVNKKAIVDFVAKVTTEGSPDFVPKAERVATFDNDGTLWCEQPMYVQLAFVMARVQVLAEKHPEWKTTQPFQAALEGDFKALADTGEKGLMELLMATHAGMSTDEFETIVKDWLATAVHPRFKKPYTECVYQPMLEVIDHLKANGFKVYITSGGGVEFMRPFTEKVYGIPPEQVIGSSIATKYEMVDGKPLLMRLPKIDFIDDKAGKPVAISKFIGRRPTMAFGNSDGDYEMLEYTTKSPGARFGLIVHHTDDVREYAYDRKSHFGKLVKALDDAAKQGWIVASMKDDWKRVFAWETK